MSNESEDQKRILSILEATPEIEEIERALEFVVSKLLEKKSLLSVFGFGLGLGDYFYAHCYQIFNCF